MKKKFRIGDAVKCNKVCSRLACQQIKFPIDVGYRLFKDIKLFNELEDFVFFTMKNVMGDKFNGDFSNEETRDVYNSICGTEVEHDLEMFDTNDFHNENGEAVLSLEDIQDLSLVLQ